MANNGRRAQQARLGGLGRVESGLWLFCTRCAGLHLCSCICNFLFLAYARTGAASFPAGLSPRSCARTVEVSNDAMAGCQPKRDKERRQRGMEGGVGGSANFFDFPKWHPNSQTTRAGGMAQLVNLDSALGPWRDTADRKTQPSGRARGQWPHVLTARWAPVVPVVRGTLERAGEDDKLNVKWLHVMAFGAEQLTAYVVYVIVRQNS